MIRHGLQFQRAFYHLVHASRSQRCSDSIADSCSINMVIRVVLIFIGLVYSDAPFAATKFERRTSIGLP